MEVRWYLPEAEDFQQDRDDGTGSGESFSSRDITRKYRNQRNPDVTKYLQDNENAGGILLTRTAAYEIAPETVRNTKYAHKLATMENDLYYVNPKFLHSE